MKNKITKTLSEMRAIRELHGSAFPKFNSELLGKPLIMGTGGEFPPGDWSFDNFPVHHTTGFFTQQIHDDLVKKNESLFGGPMMPNKGIFEQFKEKAEEAPVYRKITLKDIEDVVSSVFSVKNRRKGMSQTNMILMTGENGMFNFDWTMTFGQTLSCKFYPHYFKYYKGRYVSLFKKSGPYKLTTLGKNIIILKGTEIIRVFENVAHIFSDSYQEVYGHNFTEELVRATKNQMIQVNNYLKDLENGRE